MSKPDYELKRDVSLASRILVMEGQWDLDLGHVTARTADSEGFHIKAMGVGLEEVTPEKIVTLDHDSRRLAGEGMIHIETPMHGEVYKLRPDVGSVIHTHAPHCILLSALEEPLVPVSHDALLFHLGVARFSSPELITTSALGQEMAEALGDKGALLLRNHGIIVVGATVEEACLRTVILEKAAKMQYMANALQKKYRYVEEDLAEKMWRDKWSGMHFAHVWDYMVRKVQRVYPLEG